MVDNFEKVKLPLYCTEKTFDFINFYLKVTHHVFTTIFDLCVKDVCKSLKVFFVIFNKKIIVFTNLFQHLNCLSFIKKY